MNGDLFKLDFGSLAHSIIYIYELMNENFFLPFFVFNPPLSNHQECIKISGTRVEQIQNQGGTLCPPP